MSSDLNSTTSVTLYSYVSLSYKCLPEETIRSFAVDKKFEALSIVEFPIKGQWPPHEAPFFVGTLPADRHRDIPPSRE